jgi:hypothetical protein
MFNKEQATFNLEQVMFNLEQAMKDYRGGRYSSIHSLTLALDGGGWCNWARCFMVTNIKRTENTLMIYPAPASFKADTICIHSLLFSPLAGLAGIRAKSGNRYGSGMLHPGQVVRGRLPLLYPTFRRSHFCRQIPPRPQLRERS